MSPRSPVALLDVNVLIALAWPNHDGHAAARQWFKGSADDGWATTPITESGFVRVSSNRLALPAATTPDGAMLMLRALTAQPGHHFWIDDVRHVLGDTLNPNSVTGYRQVTDAHLIALCLKRGGRFVTFDQALATMYPERTGSIEVITHDGAG